jgi:PAS domain S-box-containing protein
LILPADAAAGPTKNVIIIHGESSDLPFSRTVIDTIEATIGKELPGAADFYIEPIDTGRFEAGQYEKRLGDLLAEKYRDIKIDLVVSFAGPAVDFVLREHDRLFPGAPVLLGFVDKRLMGHTVLPPKTSIVYVQVEAAATVRLALRAYPATRRMLVVGGTSRFDRGWEAVVRAELETAQVGVPVEYDFDAPLEALVNRIAALPADTAVLYVSMTRDGADAPHRPLDVLQAMRRVSRVPIYGLSSTFLGQGVLGGAVLDLTAHGTDLAHRSMQLLRGELPAPSTTATVTQVDWREMQRFGVSAAALPPGTVIGLRDPGIWDRFKLPILGVSSVLLAQGVLIVALVTVARRRREAQMSLETRLRFQRLLSELSLALTAVPPREFATALDAGLTRLAEGIGIGCVSRWAFGVPADQEWSIPELGFGRPATFADPADLPQTIRTKLSGDMAGACSAVAVPLMRGDAVIGALFWISSEPVAKWSVRPDDLQIVATMVSNVLQRREAEGALGQSDRLKGAILDSLPAQVAVLDRSGTIISVNHSWTEFAVANGSASASLVAVGANYLDVCRTAGRNGCDGVGEALTVVEAACRGQRTGQQVEYRCDAPGCARWFLMTAEPLRRAEGGAVITHSDITARKLNEIALRESEDRFRRLADALPVAIWMADVGHGCTYFNKQWLELTGRSLEQECGDGWLESVHPDDRDACRREYLSAFAERQRFSMDCRLRRFDGEYRWLMDVGEPRYGSDGVFHGYVGGCIDITDRRDAEQLLRDLNRRLILAQEDERRRIARELHDHLNQQLALLAIDLQQLALHPPDVLESLVESLQAAWQLTADIASDVHSIAHRLHPSKLEALGLVTTIKAHCRDLSRQSLRVSFSQQGNPAGIAPDVSLSLFRIVEEALSNVVRHSGAPEAQVVLIDRAPELVLRIADSGRGFTNAAGAPNGIGLVSMRERIEALGGTLTIASTPGGGTTVEARVPHVRSAVALSNG